MPNENEILGYVLSNVTHWKSIENQGQKSCTTENVCISALQKTLANFILFH